MTCGVTHTSSTFRKEVGSCRNMSPQKTLPSIGYSEKSLASCQIIWDKLPFLFPWSSYHSTTQKSASTIIEFRDTSLTTGREVNTPMCNWRQGRLLGRELCKPRAHAQANALGLMLFLRHTDSLLFLNKGLLDFYFALCPENSIAGPGCEVCCSASKGPSFITTGIHREDDSKRWVTTAAGKAWRQKEKGRTQEETAGWHRWFNGHEFEQAPGDGEGQGSLACCSPRGRVTKRWTRLSEQHLQQGPAL